VTAAAHAAPAAANSRHAGAARALGFDVAAVETSVLERLRRGDPAAFDEIYRRFSPGLFGFLCRLTRRPAIAEELLQETWLRLARHARTLPADVNLSAWLFTVARNLFRSHRRWRLVDLDRLRSLRLFTDTPGGGGASPFEAAAASETERRLEEALSALPVAQREILLLVAVEGFSPAEAAAIAGVRPEAARQRLSRARALLARVLETGWTMREPNGETP
jgi:RNA polymerase sigma-70 factor (ECF subfamily)